MALTNQGSIRLGRVFGIELYLHWSWFIVALIEIERRTGSYTSPVWNVLEYLALFFIVLLHEFGHSLACRQVGGRANRIVLWPLGGVAYVDPPLRPGATLWSLAAGPLVNVILVPVLLAVAFVCGLLARFVPALSSPDVFYLLVSINYINIGLLVFNMLPIYPLDGGQILRSLLWFFFGPAWSLMAAAVIGILGFAGLALLAFAAQSVWLGILAVFILFNCWTGLRQAVLLIRLARRPRRQGLACPSCGKAPPTGALWTCGRCGKLFDLFENQGVCGSCGTAYRGTRCLECGKDSLVDDWSGRRETPPLSPLPAAPQ
jgi:Zn-dependent protease